MPGHADLPLPMLLTTAGGGGHVTREIYSQGCAGGRDAWRQPGCCS